MRINNVPAPLTSDEPQAQNDLRDRAMRLQIGIQQAARDLERSERGRKIKRQSVNFLSTFELGNGRHAQAVFELLRAARQGYIGTVIDRLRQ